MKNEYIRKPFMICEKLYVRARFHCKFVCLRRWYSTCVHVLFCLSACVFVSVPVHINLPQNHRLPCEESAIIIIMSVWVPVCVRLLAGPCLCACLIWPLFFVCVSDMALVCVCVIRPLFFVCV